MSEFDTGAPPSNGAAAPGSTTAATQAPAPPRPGPPRGTTVFAATLNPPTVEQKTLFFGPSIPRAILFGIVVGAATGGAWWAVVVGTDRQLYPLALILGVVLGIAVSGGAGRGGFGIALLSAVMATITVLLAYFYINRHFFLEANEGRNVAISIWPKYEEAKQLLRLGFEIDSAQYIACGLFVASAFVVGLVRSTTTRTVGNAR